MIGISLASVRLLTAAAMVRRGNSIKERKGS
jgi:hypothetical protein